MRSRSRPDCGVKAATVRTMGDNALPEDSSASQLVTWVMCPRKYAFRYVLKAEPEFRSLNLVLGSALHSAVGWYFEQRLKGRRPPPGQAESIFEADFTAEVSEGNVRWKTKSEDEVMEDGQALVRSYLERFGDLSVAHVEQPFRVGIEDPDTGEALSRAFKGYFDLVLTDGTVVEMKSAARRWRPDDLIRHLQVGAYVAAKCVLDGGPATVDVHVIVKTKAPSVQAHRVQRGEPANRWWFRAAMDIERAILSGHYPPIPGPLCHECEFARQCESWTGDVRHAEHRLPVVHQSAA